MTAREVLDGIKGRLTKATPGPWLYDKVSGVETIPEFDLHRFDVMPETVARIDLRHEDGEFIAAAPVDVARLTRAVEAVLAAHEPVDAVMNPGRHERIVKVCTGCGTDDGNWQRWPCPTVAGVEAALNPKEGR